MKTKQFIMIVKESNLVSEEMGVDTSYTLTLVDELPNATETIINEYVDFDKNHMRVYASESVQTPEGPMTTDYDYYFYPEFVSSIRAIPQKTPRGVLHVVTLAASSHVHTFPFKSSNDAQKWSYILNRWRIATYE